MAAIVGADVSRLVCGCVNPQCAVAMATSEEFV